MSVLEIGESITFKCNNTDAEIEDTMKNSKDFICKYDGSLHPPGFANLTCEVPNKCDEPPDPDSENSGLVFEDAGQNVTILAYRTGKVQATFVLFH